MTLPPHSRRARPTIRLLREGLLDGWEEPWVQHAIRAGRHEDLHPLADLPHPLIRKATECFGEIPEQDSPEGPVAASKHLALQEIKVRQWRGGVWRDADTGTHWLVVAGLAKGDHKDRDDFYQQVGRASATAAASWKPTPDDFRLLKRETAAGALRDWKLGIQTLVADAIDSIGTQSGRSRFAVSHPILSGSHFASVEVEVAPEDPLIDALLVTIEVERKSIGSPLAWELTTRLLLSLSPPESGWDIGGSTHATLIEHGALPTRGKELRALNSQGLLASSLGNKWTHYAHAPEIAESTITGVGIRSLCGTYFVSTKNPDDHPMCPDCQTMRDMILVAAN